MDKFEETFLTEGGDYAYIGVFIIFLEKIIDIIKNLFSGLMDSVKEEATEATE